MKATEQKVMPGTVGASDSGEGGDWRTRIVDDRAGIARIVNSVSRVAVIGIKPETAGGASYYVPQIMQEAGFTIIPVPVWHGSLEVFGYRIGRFAYVTDCSLIPEASFEMLEGVEILILDALRYRPHPTHFSLEEAMAAAARIGAARTIFTHLSHDVDSLWPRL